MKHILGAVKAVIDKYNGTELIIRIIVGLIAGTILALIMPHMTWIGEFGTLFVSALKAIAPILVFVLVASALAQGASKLDRRFGTVIFLYLFTTFLSAVVAVLTSRAFPQTLSLGKAAKADVVPQGLAEVVQTLLTNIVSNPIQAMIDGNYICILMWACLFGLAMKAIATESSKAFMANVADGVSQVIRWVINLAPFGIMGLVFTNVADNGLAAFTKYGSLLLLLVGTMLLSVVSALGACGASGVAGGSLLLIPMACSLFGINNDIAMQVVGVGFIIGVIQDSVETCLNSASDVEFAATAEYHSWLRQGRQLPAFMYSKKERQRLGIEA